MTLRAAGQGKDPGNSSLGIPPALAAGDAGSCIGKHCAFPLQQGSAGHLVWHLHTWGQCSPTQCGCRGSLAAGWCAVGGAVLAVVEIREADYVTGR